MLSLVITVVAAIAAQDAPARASAPAPDVQTEARVEDVIVEGRRLEEAADSFVGQVAAPVRGRGLARWHRQVCVGVVGLAGEVAQYMVDRVSTVAQDVGLSAGSPGCRPTVMIVATDNGSSMATALVEASPFDFRTRASGTERSPSELRAFKTSDRAVRWWHVSLPVDSETGRRAVRLPGDFGGSVLDYAPTIEVTAASRVVSQIRDDLRRVVVIVDLARLGGTSFTALTDYVALVALAQVDPEAQTRSFNTILNLFDPSTVPPPSLTEWDTAYLTGLYEAEPNRVNRGAHVSAVASGLARTRRSAAGTTPE